MTNLSPITAGHRPLRPLSVILITCMLAACGSGNNTTQTFEGTQYTQATMISCEVRTGKQVVKNGRLDVTDYHGRLVTSQQWEDSPRISVNVPGNTIYPLVLTAYPAMNEGDQSQALKLVLPSPSADLQIISPDTTAIARRAQELGGYTPENLTTAAMDSTAPPDDRGGPFGESTRRYGGWH